MAADGSYEYIANQAAADVLDPGETSYMMCLHTLLKTMLIKMQVLQR